jgi:2-C-methyl-D-erythritol 4-phosphate cytidylyltransferase
MTDATDDCQLVKKLGNPVVIAEGSETNIKITSPLDLYLAEQLLRKEQTRELLPSSLLTGKVFALVGASGGIGKSILQELQNAKATILPISKSSPLFPVDLSKKEEVCALFDKIHTEYGEIDGLINVAGCLTKKELSHLSFDEIDYQLMVNLHAIIYSCKVAKIKAGGHIINISSSSFSKGRASLSVYSASKAGVVNFSQALADELTSLKVNVIVPQRTSTAMRLYNFKDEELSSLLSPEEVASRVIALLKTEGVTGQIIEVVKS